VLDELEAWRAAFGHERGRDPARYYLRIFGAPGAETWSWRFGGHHVSVHHTVVGGELRAFTPCFLGADPASSPLLGPHRLQPLADCADLAFELLRSLSEEQRRVAVLSPVPPIDLVGANRTVLNEGDGPLRLARVWRDEWRGELLDRLEQFQDAASWEAAPRGWGAVGARSDDGEVPRTVSPRGASLPPPEGSC
jgi:hypothetical protein